MKAKPSNDRRQALRFRAGGQHFAFSLTAVDAVAGYATLQPDVDGETSPTHAAFAGWLRYRGTVVPVFDLGRHLGNEQTPLLLSSRIMLFTRLHDAKQRIGLLAADITDTTEERGLASGELLEPEPVLRELLGERA